MRIRYSVTVGSALGALSTLPAAAADIGVKLELPEITTGRYEQPYVAVFLEKSDDTFVRSLSLWHSLKNRHGGQAGDRYLPDLREWWRASGTTSQLPIDGVSSATRGPGTHELLFTENKPPLNQLPAGNYQLVVEVAREIKGPHGDGPRGPRPMRDGEAGAPRGAGGASKDALESLRIPFEWPVKKATTLDAKGKVELGAVAVTLTP